MKNAITSLKAALIGSVLAIAPGLSQADDLPMPKLDLCEQVIAMVWHLDAFNGNIDRMDLSMWAYENVIGHDDLPGPWQINLASMATNIYAANPSLRGKSSTEQSYMAILKLCEKNL